MEEKLLLMKSRSKKPIISTSEYSETVVSNLDMLLYTLSCKVSFCEYATQLLFATRKKDY